MIRRVLTVLAAVAVLAACDPLGRPSLESAFGARVLDGKLHIWTGSTCHDVIEFGLTFNPYKQDARAELLMKAPNDVGVDVEYFTLGDQVPGLKLTQPLPPNFDWRSAESVRITVHGNKTGGWGDTTECRGDQELCRAPRRHLLVPGRGLAEPRRGQKAGWQDVPRHVHPEPAELIRRRRPAPAPAPWRAGRGRRARARPGPSARPCRPRARAASRRRRAMMPPSTSNIRPVTSVDSALPSQTTSGETFSGAIASKPSSWVGHHVGEHRLGHAGAGRRRDRVGGDAVAARARRLHQRERGDAGLGRAVVPWPTLPCRPAPELVLMMRASTGVAGLGCSRQ